MILGQNNTSIKKKILLPASIIYILLIVFFFMSVNWIEQKKQEKLSANFLANLEQSFLRKIDNKAIQQAIQIHIMEQNECVQNALDNYDRIQLSSCIDSLYYILEDTFLVSELNFSDSNGEYFFRYDQPEKYGDIPDGFSITRAINTDRLSYGLKISNSGKIGMIVARSILTPNNNRFYIEIQTQIGDVLDSLESSEDISLLILTEKTYLQNRFSMVSTLNAQKLIGDYYIAYGDKNQFIDIIRQTFGQHEESEKNALISRFNAENNFYTTGKISLIDEGGRYFGHLVFIKDETADVLALKKSYYQLFAIIFIISLILYFFIKYYLNFIDVQLNVSYQTLTSEIDERKAAEHQITEQRQFLQSIINGIDDSVMVINTNYQVELMNNTASQSLEPAFLSDPESPKCYELSHHRNHPCDGEEHPCPLHSVINNGKTTKVIHNHPSKKGNDRFFELVATPLFNSQGKAYAIIEAGRDITEHLNIQEELRQQKNILSHQATHDALTNLPNRVLFIDRLDQSIKKAQRYKSQVAVLFIDLDRFKEINDSLGHSYGDQVLVKIAERLKNSVRAFDTISRLGGDEFTLVLEYIRLEDVHKITSKLLSCLRKKLTINDHELYITCSIGISIYPQDGSNSETLLKNADAAMYKAKENGKNNYHFYTSDMSQKAFDRILMETNLRQAISNNELVLYYQPQVDASTDLLLGMEALVRWQVPNGEMIPPNHFIPLAVDTGLINQIDEWVMESACTASVKWNKAGLNPGRIAVNISVKELYQKDFIDRLKQIFKRTGCLPEWIELEITEDYLMKDPEKSADLLAQIKAMGVQLAIDDFGTGYSSLSYLKRLPINKLKIDQSFIRDIPKDSDDKSITCTIISLAKNMNLNVIAEGVETKEQRDFLVQHGCNNIQGYYYHKPMPAYELETLFKNYANCLA